jgi:antitoxin VapB
MALNIKDPETERLAAEIAALTGDTKTGAIRRALQERRERLGVRARRRDRMQEALRFLEREVWPTVPAAELGQVMTREEEEAILGYGESGA